jgi:hypothetical protein
MSSSKGLMSQWLRDSVDLGALPEGNRIFGVADDVIEAPYANQNERDDQALIETVHSGRIEVSLER